MSKKKLIKFVSLGNYGPFELSYNPRKDRLTAKADDITMSCLANDAIHHRETYPALALALSRLIEVETHMMTCDGHHEEGAAEASPAEGLDAMFERMEADARKGVEEQEPEMPQALKDVLKGMARSIVTEKVVRRDTPEEDLPGRPASEAPAAIRPLLESIAKDLGVPLENIRITGGPNSQDDSE